MTTRRVGYVLGTSAGGTGRHVAMLAAGCAAAGLDVGIYGPAPLAPLFASSAPFEPVTIADRPHPAADVAVLRRLRRLLAALSPDVVHAHGLRAGGLVALALQPAPLVRWPGARRPALVVTVHNAPPGTAPAAAIYAGLERLVAKRANVVLCVSPDLSARMRRLGASYVEAAVVPAPARPQGRRPGGPEPGGPEPGGPEPGRAEPAGLDASRRPVVLGVGRLAPQKGFDTLLAAAALWRHRRPEPLVAIAGAGPLADVLADQARDLGLEVSFLGARDDVAQLLNAASVFVLPSRWEGQPLVLQEAMRAGRPVIATDVGGVRDLTGDDAALLIPPGEPGALAAAVLRVLDNPELAARLGALAAARAKTLPTQADAVAAVLELYDRLS